MVFLWAGQAPAGLFCVVDLPTVALCSVSLPGGGHICYCRSIPGVAEWSGRGSLCRESSLAGLAVICWLQHDGILHVEPNRDVLLLARVTPLESSSAPEESGDC